MVCESDGRDRCAGQLTHADSLTGATPGRGRLYLECFGLGALTVSALT
jgi:hypothetical protein